MGRRRCQIEIRPARSDKVDMTEIASMFVFTGGAPGSDSFLGGLRSTRPEEDTCSHETYLYAVSANSAPSPSAPG